MNTPMLLCPTCGGVGSLKGVRCPACRGDGRLQSFGDFVLFWGSPISQAAIVLRRLEGLVRAIERAVLLAVGLLGLVGLAYEAYARPDADLFTASFWSAPSVRILFFHFTLWTDAYLWARVVRDAERVRPVERKAYGSREISGVAATWEDAAAVRGKRRVDVSRSYTVEAMHAVETAFELARKGSFGQAMDGHLLAALLPTRDVSFLFARLGIDRSQVMERLNKVLAGSPPRTDVTTVSEELWGTIFFTYRIAFETRSRSVRPLELFLALARTEGKTQEMLFDLGTDAKTLENVTAWVRIAAETRARHKKGRAAAAARGTGTMNRAMTAIATPALDALSEDLTLRAVHGLLPPFVGREKEMEALFRVLEGGGRSVVLVGLPGTGKQAFLEGLAQRMAAEDVPAVLQDKRLVSLSIPKLVAGVTVADAALRLERLFYEVAVSGNVILAVPQIEGLVGIAAGGGGGIDLSEMLESNVSKLGLLAVATTTPEGYAGAVERSAVGRSFEKLDFPEADTDEAIMICEAIAGRIEAQNRVFFSYDAIAKAVTLSDRYLHDRFLPEKAIEIMKETAHMVRTKRGERAVVSGEDTAQIVSEKAKVPVTSVTRSEGEKLLNLEEKMHGRVIGQDEAVGAVSRAIRRSRTELRAPNRPIANFLFLGPTGVGKTELAKTVAESYFGRENAMIRLDMSEYQEQGSINRLVGVPGAERGGVLTEAVRGQPFTLLLLDEIEKAHPDILNVFLQVMDDGRMTDNRGRTVDFTNVILIATSNAGSQFIQDSIRAGMTIDAIKDELVQEKLKGIFRPEFLNRFDGVIVFRPLGPEEVRKIARLMLIGIAKQLEAKDIAFQASEEAVAELAEAGFDPAFGARPLRRVIQERVQDALAQAMLKGEIGRRDIVILEAGGKLRIERRGT